jgi:hypothetical protein
VRTGPEEVAKSFVMKTVGAHGALLSTLESVRTDLQRAKVMLRFVDENNRRRWRPTFDFVIGVDRSQRAKSSSFVDEHCIYMYIYVCIYIYMFVPVALGPRGNRTRTPRDPAVGHARAEGANKTTTITATPKSN